MNLYADDLKVKDALQIYFARNNFKDGGYTDRFFNIVLGKIIIPLPNIKARIDAVKIHDIHHLITEYATTNKGEAEIGAWEIASGCGKYWVGWILNMGSFIIGMMFYQRALLKAFLKGRLVKKNLCYNTIYDNVLLNKTVGQLRKEILHGTRTKNTIRDYVHFVLWCLISPAYHLAMIAAFVYCMVKILC